LNNAQIFQLYLKILLLIQCVPIKTEDIIIIPVTSTNIVQFSKFFHPLTQQQIYSEVIYLQDFKALYKCCIIIITIIINKDLPHLTSVATLPVKYYCQKTSNSLT